MACIGPILRRRLISFIYGGKIAKRAEELYPAKGGSAGGTCRRHLQVQQRMAATKDVEWPGHFKEMINE
jgi:hypothetical protein